MARLFRLNLGGRFGTHPDSGLVARKRHPLFGTNMGVSVTSDRVQIFTGPVYSAATGTTAMTREQLLLDPYVIDGKLSNPPSELISMLLMDVWTLQMEFISPYGTVSATGQVTRTNGYTDDDGDITAPNFTNPAEPNYVDPEREKYYAPDTELFGDPVLSFATPSFHLANSPNLENDLTLSWGDGFPGGAALESLGYTRSGSMTLSASDPGTPTSFSVDTGIPIGDPEEPSTYQLQFEGSIDSESVQATATMYNSAFFLANYDVWLLPFGTQAGSSQSSSLSPIYDSLYFALYDANAETLDGIESATLDEFATSNPLVSYRAAPAGRNAILTSPPPAAIEYDEGPVVPILSEPVFYPAFAAFQI